MKVLIAIFLAFCFLISSQTSVDAASKRFYTLRPNSKLPSDSYCAVRVRKTAEVRPQNTDANQTIGDPISVVVDDATDKWNTKYAGRINGNFRGTTDEILQWGACKWGFDEDTVRAVAVNESWWVQSTNGDDGQSFGLMQVKSTDYKNTYPNTQKSTAYAVDYALAFRRSCYDGASSYLHDENPKYRAGDEWGCIGAWYSGSWYDEGAKEYIKQVRSIYREKTWRTLDFINM